MHLAQLTHVHAKGSFSKFLHRVTEGRINRTCRCNEYNMKVPKTQTIREEQHIVIVDQTAEIRSFRT